MSAEAQVLETWAEPRLAAVPAQRVLVDCGDTWFKLAVVACLREARFDVVESDGRSPMTKFGSFDLVIFEWPAYERVCGPLTSKCRAAGIVVIVTEASALPAALSWAAGRAGTGFVMRDDLAPQNLLDCLRVVAAGGVVLPGRYARQLIADMCRPSPPALTDTERQILSRIQQGETNIQIAEGLHLSVRTVKRMLQRLYLRLQLGGRVDAAVYATRFFGDPAFEDHLGTTP